ncbi:hypothetical protein N752_25175 [Desulforamulus aquiferis]|nr:hypothetical protein [Desulforamulus aquiferis]RYD02623.1 hypothetical protein N752_25175 [Desulforamulus aquiferis]
MIINKGAGFIMGCKVRLDINDMSFRSSCIAEFEVVVKNRGGIDFLNELKNTLENDKTEFAVLEANLKNHETKVRCSIVSMPTTETTRDILIGAKDLYNYISPLLDMASIKDYQVTFIVQGLY